MKVSFMNFYFSLQEMHATIGFGGGCQDAFEVYYCLDTVTQCWNIEQWKKSYFDWNKWILNAFILYKCIYRYIQWRQSGVKSTSATSRPEAFWQYILGYHNFEANFQSMASRWHWLEWRYKQRPNELLWTHGNLIKKIVSWVMPDNAKKRCLARLKTLMIS